jgi:hypothetical protein
MPSVPAYESIFAVKEYSGLVFLSASMCLIKADASRELGALVLTHAAAIELIMSEQGLS